MEGVVIVRDRPAYESAKLSALRCLQHRRRGDHAMTVAQIAYVFSSEWNLDAEETSRLAAILSKAS